MRRRSRSYRRSRGGSCLPLAVLILILLALPVLLVRSCLVSLFPSRTSPLVVLWDHQAQALLSLTLEEYVQGVIAAEVPAHFEPEALKAQAVAARTYAYRRIEAGESIAEHPEAHLSTDHQSGQAWISWDTFYERYGGLRARQLQRKIRAAAQATQGIMAFYEDGPILAVYHSTSGGRTENSEHYWTEKLPYLRAVDDPYSNLSPYHFSTASLTLDKLAQVLEVDKASDFRVIERYPSGRVKTVEVEKKWFSGRQIRQCLGLRSTWFTAEILGSEMVFSVWGYGHGVGLSQYGAQGLALEGYSYQEILQYYYQGIELRTVY